MEPDVEKRRCGKPECGKAGQMAMDDEDLAMETGEEKRRCGKPECGKAGQMAMDDVNLAMEMDVKKRRCGKPECGKAGQMAMDDVNLAMEAEAEKRRCGKPGCGTAGKLAIDDVNLANKRILVRVDYDVPMANTQVVNHGQIVNSIETIRYALTHDAKAVILMSHMGHPLGVNSKLFSLAPVADELRKLLGRDVTFLPNCVGPLVEYLCEDPRPGTVILLENLRFHLEEEGAIGKKLLAHPNSVREFRKSLRRIADIYVNDAFSTVGWNHSSVLAVGYELKVAGLALKGNLTATMRELDLFERPFMAIIGGYRIKDQVNLINELLHKVDDMIIAGSMALTFLHVLDNMPMGKSQMDREGIKMVPEIMETALRNGVNVHFPIDFVVGDRYSPDAQLRIANVIDGLWPGEICLDIGPESISCFKFILLRARRILWNGAVGEFQWPVFQEGTLSLLGTVGYMKSSGVQTLAGGIDMAFAANKFNAQEYFTAVNANQGTGISTLEGKKYPGIAVLTDKENPCSCRLSNLKHEKNLKRPFKKKEKKKGKCVDVNFMKPRRKLSSSNFEIK